MFEWLNITWAPVNTCSRYKMDWENKFKSIVEETDANLAKVKNRLGKNGRSFSTYFRLPSSNYSSAYKSPGYSDYGLSPAQQSFLNRTQLSSGTPGVSSMSGSSFNEHRADSSYSKSESLEDKLQKQNKAIDQLTEIVKRLERERDQYKQQMTELRYEVGQVSRRLPVPGRESVPERRLDQLQKEIRRDMEILRSQIKVIQSPDNEQSELSETYHLRQGRKMLDLKQEVREEMNSLRSDVDSIRSRIGRLEIEMSKKLRKSESFDKFQPSSLGISRSRSLHNADKTLGKMEVAELRSSVSSIRNKLDAMERSIQSSSQRPTNGSRLSALEKSFPSEPVDDVVSDEDSIADLADYDSADFSPTTKMKPQPLDYDDSDEELDLNDLDLSDDHDLLSDDDILTTDNI